MKILKGLQKLNYKGLKIFNRVIQVPDDLSTISTLNLEDEIEPEEVGLTNSGVEKIWSIVEDIYRTGITPAVTFCLRRHGKIVLNRSIGHARGNGPKDRLDSEKLLITPETPICQFSASKAITAMLVHKLAEQSKLNLSDTISQHIPEFGVHGKEKTTICHILSHQGGIPAPPRNMDPEFIFDHKKILKVLCDLDPTAEAGNQTAYHAITGGYILGEIIQRTSGMDIREFLKETIQKPLGFRYFNFGVADEDIPKVALNYSSGLPLVFPISTKVKQALSVSWDEVVNLSNDPRFMKTIIPAANLVSTADEMTQFYQLILNKGELNGTRIFEPSTIDRAIMEIPGTKFDRTILIPMKYCGGLMLGSSPIGIWGPYTEKAFGHVGFINIFSWADPDRDIAVSLMTTGKSLFGDHLVHLGRLLLAISEYCTRSGESANDINDKPQESSFNHLELVKYLKNSILNW